MSYLLAFGVVGMVAYLAGIAHGHHAGFTAGYWQGTNDAERIATQSHSRGTRAWWQSHRLHSRQ